MSRYLGSITRDRLLPKAVQVEDDAEYEIDSILCHQGHLRYRQYLL